MKAENDFLNWSKQKYLINNRNIYHLYFRERDIWFCRVGLNVGYEEDGKGIYFLRPVIIVKKIHKNLFIGIPLTTSTKYINNKMYYQFKYKDDKPSFAMIFQLRCFDARRLDYRSGEMPLDNFIELKQKIRDFIL